MFVDLRQRVASPRFTCQRIYRQQDRRGVTDGALSLNLFVALAEEAYSETRLGDPSCVRVYTLPNVAARSWQFVTPIRLTDRLDAEVFRYPRALNTYQPALSDWRPFLIGVILKTKLISYLDLSHRFRQSLDCPIFLGGMRKKIFRDKRCQVTNYYIISCNLFLFFFKNNVYKKCIEVKKYCKFFTYLLTKALYSVYSENNTMKNNVLRLDCECLNKPARPHNSLIHFVWNFYEISYTTCIYQKRLSNV